MKKTKYGKSRDKIKKVVYSFGALAGVIAPVAVVIACSKETTTPDITKVNHQQDDKDKFNNLGFELSTKTERTLLPDGTITSLATLTSLPGHPSLPEATDGVTRIYSSSMNATTGVATITVTFKENEKSDIATTYAISNFKTLTDEANAKINDDKNLFNNFGAQSLNGSPLGHSSGVIEKSILEGLDGHATIPTKTEGVNRTYSIEMDFDAGTAVVTITISAEHGDDQTVTYNITGFKTTSDIEIEEANTAIAGELSAFQDKINNNSIETISPASAGDEKPVPIANGIIDNAMTTLNAYNGHTQLDAAINGVTRSFKATASSEPGKIDIEVSFSKLPGETVKSHYTIEGFRTTDDEIGYDKAAFSDAITGEAVTGKPEQINGLITESDLNALTGHSNIPAALHSVNRVYNAATDDSGVATITVTFSKDGGTEQTYEYDITGFKTIGEFKGIPAPLNHDTLGSLETGFINFQTIDEKQYAYIGAGASGLFKAEVNTDGTFKGDPSLLNHETLDNIRHGFINFQAMDGKTYAYIGTDANGLYKAEVNTDGTFKAAPAPLNYDTLGDVGYGFINFQTINGKTYAYIGTKENGLFKAEVDTDGTFKGTPILLNNDVLDSVYAGFINFQTINEKQYAYIGAGASGLFKAEVDTDGTFKGDPSLLNHETLNNVRFGFINFQTIGGETYAYIGSSRAGLFKAEVDTDGTFKAAPTPLNYDILDNVALGFINFQTINGKTYAYIGTNSNGLFNAEVNTDGTFKGSPAILNHDILGDVVSGFINFQTINEKLYAYIGTFENGLFKVEVYS